MPRFIGENDLEDFYTLTRLPVCLCIDLSGSMGEIVDETGIEYTGEQQIIDGKTYDIVTGGKTRLDELNEGIKAFYEAVKGDEVASVSCELAIVGFHDSTVVLQDFQIIENSTPINIEYDKLGDKTNMEAGVQKALDLLEDRKKRYKDRGQDYYQPWLIIMSDGEPTSSVSMSQERAKELEQQKKLTLMMFAIGKISENGMSTLNGYSNRRKAISIKEGKMSQFFEWLGKSVSVPINSKPGDNASLPKDGIDDFFDIDV